MLLRRHVRRRSHDDIGAGEGIALRDDGEAVRGRERIRWPGFLGQRGLDRVLLGGHQVLGEPEVGHLDATIGREQDVARLEVAMYETSAMRRGEPFARLTKGGYHLGPGPLGFPKPLPQRRPGHVLHHDRDTVVPDLDVVDRDHVRMGELGHRLGLADEPCLAALIERVRTESLERDLSPELGVVGPNDRAHAAASNLLEDREPPDRARCRVPVRCTPRRTLAPRSRDRGSLVCLRLVTA